MHSPWQHLQHRISTWTLHSISLRKIWRMQTSDEIVKRLTKTLSLQKHWIWKEICLWAQKIKPLSSVIVYMVHFGMGRERIYMMLLVRIYCTNQNIIEAFYAYISREENSLEKTHIESPSINIYIYHQIKHFNHLHSFRSIFIGKSKYWKVKL